MSSRLETLASRLDAPLLVTDLTNLHYLSGLESSNAALVVRPGAGATLYTDFRYIESARELDGVEVVMTKRAILQDIRDALPQARAVRGRRAAVRAVAGARRGEGRARADARHRRGAAGGQVGGRARTDSPRRAHRRPRSRGPHRRDLGRPQRARDRVAAPRAPARARRGRARVRDDRRVGPERRDAARPSDGAHRRPRNARHGRLGRSRRRVLQRLHAHVLDRQAPGPAARGVRRLPGGAAACVRQHQGRGDGRRGGRPRARSHHRGGLRRGRSATASATASG